MIFVILNNTGGDISPISSSARSYVRCGRGESKILNNIYIYTNFECDFQ